MTKRKTKRKPRLDPIDHPVRYRVSTMIKTAATVRRRMQTLHEAHPEMHPAPVGPRVPSDIWEGPDSPWSRSTIYCYMSADARRSGNNVNPVRLMELMHLPGEWADPAIRPTVPAGRADAAELQAVLDEWMNPKTRRVPRSHG